ncbi:Reticuline oxidase-like protein [Quillaja saponaria]|uniref:Reticuline oxidase-like protein n=1 Tax=Quillaja saponaria TaxID=32244 RepID=A0AAD7KX30_QUISA|nr:Reticuline oxidase-like protein [Quillaja saponaria]
MVESRSLPFSSQRSTLVLALLFLVSLPLAAPLDSVEGTFLHCITNHTNPSDQVSSIVYSRANASYSSVLRAYVRNSRFNTLSNLKPLIIVTPLHVSHVQAAVICSKNIGIQLKIRSGGHDYEGISYTSEEPFIIVDMFKLRSVTVDIAKGTVVIQAGATLGEVYYRIWEKSKVHSIPAGVCPTVGVGGHVSGGGYGILLRKYGLSVDHVIDAQIVDLNGRILDKMSMGNDLFWAIRGGGGASFGVILSYTVQLVSVPETVSVFRVEMMLDQNASVTDMVYQWQQVAPVTDDRLFLRMLIQPVSSNVRKGQKTIRASVLAEFLGGAEELVSLLNKEFPLLSLKKENCMEMSWIDSVVWWANFHNGNSPNLLLDRNPNSANFLKRKSDYVQKPISKAGLEWIWQRIIELGKTGMVFNPYGGKMNEIPASATPFPHRAGNLFKIQYSVNWNDEEEEMSSITQIRRLYTYMTPFVSKNPRSAYLNYRDLDIGINHHDRNSSLEGEVYGVKYFNSNYDRLVKVKTAVDPHNFLRNKQSIPPSK